MKVSDAGDICFRRWANSPCYLLLILLTALSLWATPTGDPICGAPSSFDLVTAIRVEAAAKKKTALQSLLRRQALVLPTLSIQRPAAPGLPRLILGGAAGRTYHLEASSDLSSGQWATGLSVILGNEPFNWSDESVGLLPFQFYRLREGDLGLLDDSAANFRLLDQQGVARDLFYNSNLDAIAVLAAGADLNNVTPMLPILNDAAATYSNKIQIWILLSDAAAVRSNVLAQTKSLKINFPVLADTQGLAARSVGISHAGELAVVQPPGFTVVYRGQVASATQSSAGESFFSQTLRALKASQPLTYLRTPVMGPRLFPSAEGTPDYAKDVAPIYYKYCAVCHRANGVAPFALTNYSVVSEWAASMKHALLSNKMPPWHADPEYGHFANDLSLPGDLKSTLIRWIDAGAPRGQGPDPLAELPPPSAFDQWPPELGVPDALVTIPVQQIKATGPEPYRYIFTQAPNPTNAWLKAAIIRPSNYRSVHHYLVWLNQIGNSGTPDNSSYESHIAEFVPGNKPFLIPSDAYVPFSKSNKLTFNLHYNTYGEATNDQPTLALWFHKTRPAKIWVAASVSRSDFSISPRTNDFPVQTEMTVPSQITIHRFNPHMHVRGKRMKYDVVYPNGTRETLLSVPDYDFNWQVGYDLAKPKVIPAGSRIIASGAFDNSAQNLSNPDPSATVHWGDQSWMEMFVGFFDYTQ
jgi:hypothetical protein